MKRTFAFALVAAALVAAGCGSSSNSSSNNSNSGASAKQSKPKSTAAKPSSGGGGGGASSSLSLAADAGGALKFDKSSLSTKAGTVQITMKNPSNIPHGIAVEGKGVDKTGKVVGQGGTSTLSLKLKPGKYTFYCPVPGHRQAGMQGTLTVK